MTLLLSSPQNPCEQRGSNIHAALRFPESELLSVLSLSLPLVSSQVGGVQCCAGFAHRQMWCLREPVWSILALCVLLSRPRR